MKLIFYKFLVSYLSLFLIMIPIAHAENPVEPPVMTTLTAGQPAPFDGTLFSTSAATQLLLDLEYNQQRCQIEIDRAVGQETARMQLLVDRTQASLDACQMRYDTVLEIKTEQIDFLNDQLIKANRNNSPMWFAVGVVAGVFITGAAAWSLHQTASAN